MIIKRKFKIDAIQVRPYSEVDKENAGDASLSIQAEHNVDNLNVGLPESLRKSILNMQNDLVDYVSGSIECVFTSKPMTEDAAVNGRNLGVEILQETIESATSDKPEYKATLGSLFYKNDGKNTSENKPESRIFFWVNLDLSSSEYQEMKPIVGKSLFEIELNTFPNEARVNFGSGAKR